MCSAPEAVFATEESDSISNAQKGAMVVGGVAVAAGVAAYLLKTVTFGITLKSKILIPA